MASVANLNDSESVAAIRRSAVALLRVSDEEQARDDKGGLPRQQWEIEQIIQRENLDCRHFYVLKGVSGTQVLQNPEVQEILRLIRERVVSCLVVSDLDRLIRISEPADYAIFQVFKDAGAVIYTSQSHFDVSKRDSALFTFMRASFSGFELGLMKDRQQGAREAKRRVGKCPTNELTLPLGVSYNRKQQKFFYNEKIQTVIEAFRLYDEEGITNYHEIGRRLGLLNVTVRNLLRNPLYTGWRVIDKKRGEKTVSRTGKTYRKKIDRNEDDVIRVQVIDVPAVTQACYDRVQAAMDRVCFNHQERRRNEPVQNFGAGIGRCGHCGEILICCSGKKSGGVRHGYYHCKSNHYRYRERLGGCRQPNVRQPELDELIEAFTVQTLTNVRTLTDLVVGSLQRSNELISPFPAPQTNDQLKSFKEREKRLYDAWEAGEMPISELRARKENLRREVAKLEAREEAERRKPRFELLEFVRLVVRGAMRLKRLNDRQEKKAIILSLFSEIFIKDQTITAFRFRPDVPLIDGVSETAVKEAIQLEKPFRLAPEPVPIPPGHKRCSCCENVHPLSMYFPNKGQCKPCIKVKMREAHIRRKEKKKSRI